MTLLFSALSAPHQHTAYHVLFCIGHFHWLSGIQEWTVAELLGSCALSIFFFLKRSLQKQRQFKNTPKKSWFRLKKHSRLWPLLCLLPWFLTKALYGVYDHSALLFPLPSFFFLGIKTSKAERHRFYLELVDLPFANSKVNDQLIYYSSTYHIEPTLFSWALVARALSYTSVWVLLIEHRSRAFPSQDLPGAPCRLAGWFLVDWWMS